MDYKKLLPSIMRKTRWGEFIEAFQSIVNNILDDKIHPIYNQYTKENATEEELKNIAYYLGYDFYTLSGYTATKDFLLREVESITKKIKTKGTRRSYKELGKVFYLFSEAVAIKVGTDVYFNSILYPSTITRFIENHEFAVVQFDPEEPNVLFYLNGLPIYQAPAFPENSAGFGDTINFFSLDMSSGYEGGNGEDILLTGITKLFYFQYYCKKIENANEFLSMDTLKVLEYDMNLNHRATEIPYYQPIIKVVTNYDNTLNTKTFYNYDNTITATQESILIQGNLSQAVTFQIGTGRYTTIDETITGVQAPLYTIPDVVTPENIILYGNVPDKVHGWYVDGDDTNTSKSFSIIIEEGNKFLGFTELALLNASGDCILYSTFPKIQWIPSMLNNIKLKFEIN